MVKFGMQHGTSGASALAFGYFGNFLGPVFHRYADGYRFSKLACDLVEKHGFIAYQAKSYHGMGTSPLDAANLERYRLMRATFRKAIETGDLLSLATPCAMCCRPSPAERSAGRGVARVGDGAGVYPKGQVR